MGMPPASVLFLFTLFLISYATACDRCVHETKASYFTDNKTLASGACGYKSSALGFNNGYLAAASPSIFRSGAGCGACFQVRCKHSSFCSKKGVIILVSDLKNSTDGFILSHNAFSAMALRGKDNSLPELVDVEYERVPCDHGGKNLSLRVNESSNKKANYLAVEVVYQGGQTDMVGIDVAGVHSSNWGFLINSYGAVWTSDRVPQGGLQFRFLVTAGYDGKSAWAKSVLPANWVVGQIYDTGLQITDIAQENCSPCDNSRW